MSGKDVSWCRGGVQVVLLRLPEGSHANRFNDLGTDPAGRIYVGTVDYDPFQPERAPREGTLYLLDADGTARVVDEGLGLSNGIGVSPDGATLYVADSWARTVWRYERGADGGVARREPLFVWSGSASSSSGGPDGLAVTADGRVVVAVIGGRTVAVLSPGGALLDEVDVPDGTVTSVCFGDADLKALYVTTHGDVLAGGKTASVWRWRGPLVGHPVAPATVQPVG